MAGLICICRFLFLCIFVSLTLVCLTLVAEECEVYFPVVSSYFYYDAENKPFYFYGLLYDATHVVTLAHDPYKVPTFVIAGFTIDPNEKIETASDRSSIASFKTVSRYGNERLLKNIGIFTLNTSIEQTNKIKYYKFPTEPLDIPVGTTCMAKRYDEKRKRFIENQYKIKPKIDCNKDGDKYVSICADWIDSEVGWVVDPYKMLGTPLVCTVGRNFERTIVGLLAEYTLYSKTLTIFSDLSRLKDWFDENLDKKKETNDVPMNDDDGLY